MNTGQLQEWLDRVAMTSWQRWMLIVAAVMAAFAASTINSLVEGRQTTAVLVLIVAMAVASTLQADSHFALATEVFLVWQWLVSADDVTTPWSIGFAMCILVFHCCVAIMAVTPITAVIGVPAMTSWARRGAWVAGFTTAMWLLVTALDQRRASGLPLLTAAALAVLTALVVVAARRSTAAVEPITDDAANASRRGGR